MQKTLILLHTVFVRTPVELYLFWLSYFAIGWGLLLLSNPMLFLVSESYSTFHDLSWNPVLWFLIYTGVGTFGLFACGLRKTPLMQVAAMLLTCLWFFTSFAFFIVNHTITTGTFIYGTFSVCAAWTYLRVANHSFDVWNT